MTPSPHHVHVRGDQSPGDDGIKGHPPLLCRIGNQEVELARESKTTLLPPEEGNPPVLGRDRPNLDIVDIVAPIAKIGNPDHKLWSMQLSHNTIH